MVLVKIHGLHMKKMARIPPEMSNLQKVIFKSAKFPGAHLGSQLYLGSQKETANMTSDTYMDTSKPCLSSLDANMATNVLLQLLWQLFFLSVAPK